MQERKDILTGVDELYRLILERGSVSKSDAANSLKVSKSIVNMWADSLAEAGMIKVRYTFREEYFSTPDADKDSMSSALGMQIRSIFSTSSSIEDQKHKEQLKSLKLRERKLEDSLVEFKKIQAQVFEVKRQVDIDRQHVLEMEQKLAARESDLNMREELILRRENEVRQADDFNIKQARSISSQMSVLESLKKEIEEKERIVTVALDQVVAEREALRVLLSEISKTAPGSSISCIASISQSASVPVGFDRPAGAIHPGVMI